MSRPLIGSGQWSQTTTGMFHPAARLKPRCGGSISNTSMFSQTSDSPIRPDGLLDKPLCTSKLAKHVEDSLRD